MDNHYCFKYMLRFRQ